MPSDPQTAFFSYCRVDSEFALKFAEDLKAAGASVWMDQLDIEPGTTWDGEVEEALKRSPRMLVILSPVSASSENVRDEVSYAISRQKRIIPILYRDCDVPFRLARLQYVDFRIDYARGLKVLIKTLGMEQAPQANTAPAPAPSVMTPAHVPVVEEQPPANDHAIEKKRKAAAVKRKKKVRLRSGEQAQSSGFGLANQLYHIGGWRLFRIDTHCCFWYNQGELALQVEGHLQALRLWDGKTAYVVIHGEPQSEAAFLNQFWKTQAGASPIVVGETARFEIKGWLSPRKDCLKISVLPDEIRITDNSGFVSQIVLPRHEARIHYKNYLRKEFDYRAKPR